MTEELYRVLALDVGDKRIGVAVSDQTRMLVRPVTTVQRKNRDADVRRIADIVQDEEIRVIVIGLPKNMDGSEGAQAQKVRGFGKQLARQVDAEIVYEDERLSTFTAIESLVERGVKTGHERELVDMEAASVILQAYLDRAGNRKTLSENGSESET